VHRKVPPNAIKIFTNAVECEFGKELEF